MKRTIVFALLAATLCSIGACKKEKEEEQPAPKRELTATERALIGEWGHTHKGKDANGNEQPDEAEMKEVDPTEVVQLTFYESGGGAVDFAPATPNASSELTTWRVQNSQKEVVIFDAKGTTLMVLGIIDLNSSELKIENNLVDDEHGWSYYTKR